MPQLVLELERVDKTVDLENGFQVIRYKSTSGEAYRDSFQAVTDPGNWNEAERLNGWNDLNSHSY
jgi:hypothetical protein